MSAGNRGPNPVCPVCGGRAWLDPATQRVVCKGRVVSWLELEGGGRRPVYGQPCGWSAVYALGCCGGPVVNRFSGEAGGGLEVE